MSTSQEGTCSTEIVYTVNEDLDKSSKYSASTCNVHDFNVTFLTKWTAQELRRNVLQ